jgi:signal transduction histidine kinase
MLLNVAATYAAGLRAAVNGGRGWLAVVLMVAALAICALSVNRYVTLERELTDSALARRAVIGSLAATALSDKFERLTDVGIALATRVRFQELVGAGRWSDAAQILRRVPEDFAFLDRLFIADVHGTLMADVPELPGVVGTNFAQRDWFKGVSRDWKPYISDLYRRTAEPKRNVIAVSVPIRDAGAGIAGILVLQVRLEKFFDWAERIDPDPASRVLVVDGAWQAGFDSKVPAGEHARDPAADPMVGRLAPAGAGVRIVRTALDGEDLVFDYAPASHRWGVATLQPASVTFAARDLLLRQMLLDGALIALLGVAAIVLGTVVMLQRRREEAERAHREEREHSQAALARQAERLRIVHDIDRAIIAEAQPDAIAAAVLQPLRGLLGVPRAIVNMFDHAAGEVEWLAAAGRRRTHVGPGVRYPLRLMGDVEALRRGEPQRIDVHALPPGPEVEALLASGVHAYMAVPMIAGGELIGALSFGGERNSFSIDQIAIAQEVATQLAIAIAQARLFERVRRHAEELELRVNERTAELKTANRELESFSYSVSHDLRAPLRAVDGYALMLVEDYGPRLDDEGRRLLGVVRESAAQMGRLIDDLLKFSQVGRKALALAPVDMRSLAVEVVAELAQVYPKARIDVGELPAAAGDRALLRHAWMNLIGNALKYSARNESPRVEISGYVEGAESVYQVRDNGAGFDMRYYEKLFRVFQRLHREEEFEGSGVGLAIVQRVIVRHGGRVWGEGVLGQGACFRFALPKED